MKHTIRRHVDLKNRVAVDRHGLWADTRELGRLAAEQEADQ
jgi:hypothetical protein